ncbi:MAG: alpha-ketoglutarate-dependent dioxygenase AlkB [Rhodothermales bacterium]|nr:alpha-ketoglutarate-dependent dioxygenase AlkB [Rhodothermales bacterium]MBO6779333.1 alpha-ketoglutarate-dependent dioxygenase AlkB [Rhodothermales bacterium]
MEPDLTYEPDFLDQASALRYQDTLTRTIPWEQHQVRLFGKWIDTPRRSAWFGDPGVRYGYSGQVYDPHPWTAEVAQLRAAVESASGARFNSVLLNLYRTGQDSMGWHADDEAELGERPVIASLSLGATRRMRFRLKENHRVTHAVDLASGSLLIMGPDVQAAWQHALPKTKRVSQPRINLTFRLVGPRG